MVYRLLATHNITILTRLSSMVEQQRHVIILVIGKKMLVLFLRS